MPNHLHAIIHIGENDHNRICTDAMPGVSGNEPGNNINPPIQHQDAMHGVSTGKFGPQLKNLSSVVRGYKSALTMYARKNNIDFDWQPRFHDHIIRDEKSYNNIRNYILFNPSNWKQDCFNK